MDHYEFYEINAFSDRNLNATGNPAAICPVEKFPDEKTMGDAAMRLAAPMTSFICPDTAKNTFHIRHFSPAEGEENHVCGHATVAAAEFLALRTPALRNGGDIVFKLNPKFGINADNACRVSLRGKDITVTMPAITEMQQVDDPAFYERLARTLRVEENAFHAPAYYAPRIINYVVSFDDPETFLRMTPDFEKLENLARSRDFPHEGIMATVKSNRPGFDIMTRVFLPITGVDEDIACGSANCSVIPYWTLKRQGAFPEGKNNFRVLFPYPPGWLENKLGGVQNIAIDHAKEDVSITGQATFSRTRFLSFRPALLACISAPRF